MKKVVGFLALIFLIGFGTYQVMVFTEPADDQIAYALSQEVLKITLLEDNSAMQLVPEGVVLKTNDTNTLTFIYLIKLEEGYSLDATLSSDATVRHLLMLDATFESIDNQTVRATLNISMSMPTTEEEAQNVMNQTLDLTLGFTAFKN